MIMQIAFHKAIERERHKRDDFVFVNYLIFSLFVANITECSATKM